MTPAPQFALVEPVVWNALGYPFEAAPMLAALAACLSVRVWICLKDAPDTLRARAIDLTVTGIALLFSGAWVVLQHPSPFFALLSGCGFGALGTGIIALSLRWVKRLAPLADEDLPARASAADQAFRRAGNARSAARRARPFRQRRR